MASERKKAAQPKYLNDFSKALAQEVRILLQEVGKLRDERRQLQFEVAELLAVKSRHGPGGSFSPEWAPPPPPAVEAPPPPEPEAVPSGALVPVGPAKPGWRAVPKKVERKPRQPRAVAPAPAPAPAPPPPAPPAPTPVAPAAQMPAWANWKPNPLYAPVPRQPAPPPPTGLFGPPTPPPGR